MTERCGEETEVCGEEEEGEGYRRGGVQGRREKVVGGRRVQRGKEGGGTILLCMKPCCTCYSNCLSYGVSETRLIPRHFVQHTNIASSVPMWVGLGLGLRLVPGHDMLY